MIKKIIFIVSVVMNIIVLLLIALAIAIKPAMPERLSFYRLTEDGSAVTAACVISAPRENAAVSFGTAEISLRENESCSLQYSLVRDGSQLNIAADPLYDHAVVSIERTGFGLIIRAIAPGTCVLQAVSSEGIKNLAVITVEENF